MIIFVTPLSYGNILHILHIKLLRLKLSVPKDGTVASKPSQAKPRGEKEIRKRQRIRKRKKRRRKIKRKRKGKKMRKMKRMQTTIMSSASSS